jgi:hypothetical protein
MASNPFVKAEKSQAKLRLAIDGPTGSGKTFTALIAATVMATGGKIAVIDTERRSSALYADKFSFDAAYLEKFSPQHYIELIQAAEESGYDVIVIDSLSHAWEGEGGALDMVDAAQKRSQSGNSFTAWKDVTPIHRRLIDAMVQSKCHIIATMRSKMEYAIEKDERTGKNTVRKLGLAPIQRQGMEYEFTIVGDMDTDHNLVITKSRCDFIADAAINKPSAKFFQQILDWLNTGKKPAPISTPEFTESEPASASTPAPTPPGNGSKPSGNGSKPTSNLDQIGLQLYPGCWEIQKKKMLDFYKNDAAKLMDFLTKRKHALLDQNGLKEHVARTWPGYERFVDQVGGIIGNDYNRLELLTGISMAVNAKTEMPTMDDPILLNVILDNLTVESQIPESFR